MMHDSIKFKKVESIVLHNGFAFCNQSGSHRKYKRNSNTIILSCHGVNKMIWRRLIKENNLVW